MEEVRDVYSLVTEVNELKIISFSVGCGEGGYRGDSFGNNVNWRFVFLNVIFIL